MRICTIIGARPQFVKASVVSRAIADTGIDEVLVHTGQHYDPSMSKVFFDQLGIKAPDVNLDVRSGSHAVQTGAMMLSLERFVDETGPYDWMLVYGDTNSTIAGALVAAKCGLPIAHVEAGLRSFNRRMPEEINRIVTDSLSSLLFAPTETAVSHLQREGVHGEVILSGDVMFDATVYYADLSSRSPDVSRLLSKLPDTFAVATVHRAENTDDSRRLDQILRAFADSNRVVVFPAHPRTRKLLKPDMLAPNVILLEPVGYLEMLALVRAAELVFTDSGGLQKEAYWLSTPCITLREETEWVETLANGWNQLAGYTTEGILACLTNLPATGTERPTFGMPSRGLASQVIADSLLG